MNKKWIAIFFFLLFLAFFSYTIASVLSFIFGEEAILSGNVALIPVSGTIMVGNGDGLFEDSIANSKDLIDNIKKASANPEIKAILLDINSPGGSAVASQEVAREVKRVNKTVYAFIREQGTSGAYWIASSANKVVSEELALTGSIGVISSYLDFSGLLADYNVSYQRLIAGKYKDIGTPFRKLSKEEEVMLQKRLDIIHDYFINAVADNRKLPKEKVRDLATGMFYLGIEAKEMGLVDELGDMDYVTEMIKKDLNLKEINFVEYKQKRSLIDMLRRITSNFGFWIGKGISTPKAESMIVR